MKSGSLFESTSALMLFSFRQVCTFGFGETSVRLLLQCLQTTLFTVVLCHTCRAAVFFLNRNEKQILFLWHASFAKSHLSCQFSWLSSKNSVSESCCNDPPPPPPEACWRGNVCHSLTRAFHAGLKQHSWTTFSSSTMLCSGCLGKSQSCEQADPPK